MKYKHLLRHLPAQILVVGILCLVIFLMPDFAGAAFGPFFWLFKIWSGDPSLALHNQIPVLGSSNHLGRYAAIVVGCSLFTFVMGYVIRRPHYAKRVALILLGVSWYLYIVSSPWSYTVSRLAIGFTAFVFIFCARLLKRYFKPIKTVLFFIGIGFTCEALAWALADPIATIMSAAAFSITSAFFTRIDKKRMHKTRVLSALGLLAFVTSLGIYIKAPLWLEIIAISFALSRVFHMIHIYGNPDGGFVTTFDSTSKGLTDICYPHIEMHGEKGSRIVYHAPELQVTNNPRTHLTMFKIASIFGDTDSVLIGFGTPNAAISLYDYELKIWKRLSAYMFFRQESRISKLDELQVGLYFELRGLSPEIRARLLKAMESRTGIRTATCAHATARALTIAGFTLGQGREMSNVYRPSHLASLIWRFGLQHDGQPVTFRIVNTSKLEVRDHLVGVWTKEFASPIRLVTKVFHGKKPLPDHVSAQYQNVKVRKDDTWKGRPVSVKMSRPNIFGTFLTLLWGRHVEFRVSVAGLKVHPDLSTPMVAFPGQLNLVSKIKKYILFSRPVVALINNIKNYSFDRYDGIPVDAAIEMLSPTTSTADGSASTERILWNFAIIKCGDTYDFRLSPLKNQDPRSQNSKLRKASNWILAKHVVATGYNEHTVFAGEGWVECDEATNRLTLFINNNSGTYKPTAEHLESAGKLIAGFGIQVKTQVC